MCWSSLRPRQTETAQLPPRTPQLSPWLPTQQAYRLLLQQRKLQPQSSVYWLPLLCVNSPSNLGSTWSKSHPRIKVDESPSKMCEPILNESKPLLYLLYRLLQQPNVEKSNK